uniref:GMC_oxred_C domain-containing protein n=1 Tax=Macrostomum lignano TaxID=282301 RepID=A0A1I8FEF9_9PLAT
PGRHGVEVRRPSCGSATFDEGGTLPTPFNIIPSPKSFLYAMAWLKDKVCAPALSAHTSAAIGDARPYQALLDGRRQKSDDKQGVTEDDLNEIKGDISAFPLRIVGDFPNQRHCERPPTCSSGPVRVGLTVALGNKVAG